MPILRKRLALLLDRWGKKHIKGITDKQFHQPIIGYICLDFEAMQGSSLGRVLLVIAWLAVCN
jgi:hypothetical protein